MPHIMAVWIGPCCSVLFVCAATHIIVKISQNHFAELCLEFPQVQHRRPSPPDVELLLRSHILEITGGPSAGYPGTGDKVSVEVEMNLMLPEGGKSNLLSSARGVFKRVAAVRAM